MTDELTGKITSVVERKEYTRKKDNKLSTLQNVVLQTPGGIKCKLIFWGYDDLSAYRGEHVRITGLTPQPDGSFWGNYKTQIDDRLEENIPPDDDLITPDKPPIINTPAKTVEDNITPGADGIEFRVLVSRTKNYQKVEYEATGFESVEHAERYYNIMNSLAKKALEEF